MHFTDCIYIYYIEYIVGKYMQVIRSLLVLPVVLVWRYVWIDAHSLEELRLCCRRRSGWT